MRRDINKRIKVSIIGTAGVPAAYGGFETLAENLVRFASACRADIDLSIFCSSAGGGQKHATFLHAGLRYIRWSANGVQSIPYDVWSMVSAARHRDDVCLVLGVSGALFLPFLRLISNARIITNIDGIEWRRQKWKGLARLILRWSEWAAVRCSHVVVSDNDAITDYVRDAYGVKCMTIPYGGDHALTSEPDLDAVRDLPEQYALALCRIEPENNVKMVLEAWGGMTRPLVFVGNWERSEYGRKLKARFKHSSHIHLLDPIYEPGALRAIRDRASLYVHGHSAGGTNPSLVEMMHFGVPVVAHGCVFNRKTTEGRACYFTSADELVDRVESMSTVEAVRIGEDMQEIARRRYTWEAVGSAYLNLIEE